MRTLILDHYYPDFVASVYRASPGLESAPFADQQAALDAGMFGETQFQAAALRSLGHEALHLPVNVPSLLSAFARDNDLRIPRRGRVAFRRRRGVIPLPALRREAPAMETLLPVIADHLGPDLLHIQCMDVLAPRVVASMRRAGRIITGQTAAPKPIWKGMTAYDLVMSSLPNFVARFRREGVRAEYLPLAFAPEVVDHIGHHERDVPLSFVGSVSPAHRGRVALLEATVAEGLPIDIWSNGTIPGSRRHEPAWGAGMYRVLARSQLTLNSHGEHAAGYANNLRLFEATGMGALLLTEAAPNLGDLFSPGDEVVTYRDVLSLTRAASYYLDHPDEARAIADAGRARTLRDHTWTVRMAQLLALIEPSASPVDHRSRLPAGSEDQRPAASPEDSAADANEEMASHSELDELAHPDPTGSAARRVPDATDAAEPSARGREVANVTPVQVSTD
jgi:spore maturation protein CgeB